MKNNRKKILISAYACEPNGGSEARIGWNFVKYLSEFHEIWVITRESNRFSIENNGDEKIVNRVHWLYFDYPKILRYWKRGSKGHRLYYFLWQVGIFFYLKGIYSREKFDIVHHVTFVNYWQPSFLPFLKNIKFVFGPVGGGEYAPWNMIKQFPIKELLYEILRNISKYINIYNPILRLTSKRTLITIAANRETAKILSKIGYTNIHLLTQVALESSYLEKLESDGNNNDGIFRFISIGRLIHWKGFDMAIEALMHLKKKNYNFEYYIVGEGPFRKYLEKKVKLLKINEKIKFIGHLNHDNIFKLLNKCDVLIHPSLHDSGGLVIVEAMGAGKPVICLDIGGPGYLVDKSSGIKIEVKNRDQVVSDLVKAMCMLIENKLLLKKMGQSAKNKVEKELIWEHKTQIINEIYFEVFE